ncbi:MAG: peptidoglycan endopeptidase [Microbacteriaceae bacterium]|nr:peptidoglycan endopeptidase [Microbacteriaceae bacterium]
MNEGDGATNECRGDAGVTLLTVRETRSSTARPKNLSPLRRRSGPLSLAVIAISTGLFATLAIPAYASTQAPDLAQTKASAKQLAFVQANAQTLEVAPAIAITAVQRDSYTTTAKVEQVRVASARAVAINPGMPGFSLDAIVADGLQYIGTPYVYGGSSPAGFDCSGFVLFLYSHVGIHLTHDARAQGNAGTTISEADALPGDLVIFNGGAHDGIYMGNHQVMDAPKPGGAVSVRPIWTDNVFFVRIGI